MKFMPVGSTVFRLRSMIPTLNEPIGVCSFLFNISNRSPVFNVESWIGVLRENGPVPSIWNLELVLYFHEFANMPL